ncbi:viral A-type inclusion protein [Reticulomyxa filosa]|uniref:Viral A-type inclusion protein n=1 Tax=Reticulomyxa filosa TaxID=46433 RepID=X6MPM2_RETFI|nr:viral A-type inclusion protein [Reticulomyxa filosa]|eukprot:ETO15933.1 viral A-type inclusion protein [Reticulomyxa filosa]
MLPVSQCAFNKKKSDMIFKNNSISDVRGKLVSQLSFVEIPGIDKLLENANDLRMKEGPTLNKEIIAFANLRTHKHSKLFSICLEKMTINFTIHNKTHNNSALVCFDNENSLELKKLTLQYAKYIGNITNFPVINNNRIQGLLSRYHMRLHNVIKQLEAFKYLKSLQVNGMLPFFIVMLQHQNNKLYAPSNEELTELRKTLAEKENLIIELYGDKEKLSEIYASFRKKYSELVERKTNNQKDLIESEEKCLSISKALVELQIENNELKRQQHEMQAQLETKLSNIKNNAVETASREKLIQEENIEIKNKYEGLLQEKKDLSMEYVVLRQNYINLTTEFDKLKEKTEEKTLELTNANKVLEETRSINEKLLVKEEELTKIQQHLELKIKELRQLPPSVSEADPHKRETDTLNKEDKQVGNTAQQQQLERDVEVLKEQLQITTRQITSLESQVNESRQRHNELDKENVKLREQLRQKTEEYKLKLFEYLHRATDPSESTSENSIVKNKLYQEILQTHSLREDELMQDAELERRRNNRISQQLSKIQQRYQALLQFTQGIVPDHKIPSLVMDAKTMQENIDTIAETLVKGGVKHREVSNDSRNMWQRVEELNKQLEREKVNQLMAIERTRDYQEKLQKEILSLKKVLHEEHSNCGAASQQLKAEYQSNIKRLLELEHVLETQIEQNKIFIARGEQKIHGRVEKIGSEIQLLEESSNKSGKKCNEESKIDNTDKIELIDRLKQLESEVKELREKNSSLKQQLQKLLKSGWTPEELEKLEKELEETKDKARKMEFCQDNIVLLLTFIIFFYIPKDSSAEVNTSYWERLKQLETDKAQLVSRANEAEEELKTIHQHYQTKIAKYVKQISKLKNEMNELKQKYIVVEK